MALKWYPIDPLLTTDGYFAALANLENAASYKPLPDTVTSGRFGIVDGVGSSEEVSVLGNLGVISVASVNAERKTKVIFRDVMAWHEPKASTGHTGPIFGTRWGAGYRLIITMTIFNSQFDLNLKSVAVATEIGLSNASFELVVYGVPDISILKGIPIQGRFDTNTWKAFCDAETKLFTYLSTHRNTLIATPLQIMLNEAPPGSTLERARAVLFATRQIRAGVRLDKALSDGNSKKLFTPAIKQTYQQFFGTNDMNSEPNTAMIKAAEKWLKGTDAAIQA